MIEARVIADSIGEHSPRLTTFLTRYPKFVHAEHCRHRTHSFCVSSSRAIPLKKTLEEVQSDDELRAVPAFWGAEQKGMSPGEELSDDKNTSLGISIRDCARATWHLAALRAAKSATVLAEIGTHKSICNRILDPFLHVNVLVTSCEPGLLNFFGLRLDEAADPTIRALAEAMWAAWNESELRKLQPGEWHLPFIEQQDWDELLSERDGIGDWDACGRKVSTARCARLSYTSFETGRRSTVEEDLALYDRLVNSRPIHASPAEHQATPDNLRVWPKDILGWTEEETLHLTQWKNPHLHGNLPGWVQHRKLLPDEAVAPLPDGYEYRSPS